MTMTVARKLLYLLLLMIRSIAGAEFESWLGTALQMFLSKDRSDNCLSHLRQLMVLTTVSKYNRK